MPAHKDCELLLHTSESAATYVGNCLGKFHGFESYVINQVPTTRLVK